MKILSSLFLSLTICVGVISLGLAQPAAVLSQTDNQFAFDLYSRLDSKQGNIFYSPYSLSSALSMAYEGAHGQTAQEMAFVLHFNSEDSDRLAETSANIQQINGSHKSYELTVTNALWAQKAYPFKDDYVKLVETDYFAEARNLDFVSDPEGSRTTINSWISDHTHDRINDLLPPQSITAATRLVLTDAVYFKGKWEAPFKKEYTQSATFWLAPTQAVEIKMMSLEGKSFEYMDNDQAQMLQLPYKDNDISMLIILPRSKDIQGLEKTLSLDEIMQWQGNMTLQETNVFLPRFKFDKEYEMSKMLSAMGMKLAFDPNKADFLGMTNKENFYIGGVFHKAWVETNEEGTEAAAATAIVMVGSAMPVRMSEPKIFRADHPFIFIIQDNKSGRILFMGRVSDPREK